MDLGLAGIAYEARRLRMKNTAKEIGSFSNSTFGRIISSFARLATCVLLTLGKETLS
jgi:hypothetical protein